MSLPLSHVVDVNIALAAQAVPLMGFGELLILTDETSVNMTVSERIRRYSSAEELAVDFPGTEAYKIAQAYTAQGASEIAVGLVDSAETPAEGLSAVFQAQDEN